MNAHIRARIVVASLLMLVGCSCGEASSHLDAGLDGGDAGQDAGIDAGQDAGIDAGQDGGRRDFQTDTYGPLDCEAWGTPELPPLPTDRSVRQLWRWTAYEQPEILAEEAGMEPLWPPIVSPDGSSYVALGTLGEIVVALDAEGRYRWHERVFSFVNDLVVAPDGSVFASTTGNGVYGWRSDGTGIRGGGSRVSHVPPEIAGQIMLATGTHGELFIAAGDRIYAVCPTTGELAWVLRMPSDLAMRQLMVEPDGTLLLLPYRSLSPARPITQPYRVSREGNVTPAEELVLPNEAYRPESIRRWQDRTLVPAITGMHPATTVAGWLFGPDHEPWRLPIRGDEGPVFDGSGGIWVFSLSSVASVARYVNREEVFRLETQIPPNWVWGHDGSLIAPQFSTISRWDGEGRLVWSHDLIDPMSGEPASIRVGVYSLNLGRRGVLYTLAATTRDVAIYAVQTDVTAPTVPSCLDEGCNFARNRSVSRPW